MLRKRTTLNIISIKCNTCTTNVFDKLVNSVAASDHIAHAPLLFQVLEEGAVCGWMSQAGNQRSSVQVSLLSVMTGKHGRLVIESWIKN